MKDIPEFKNQRRQNQMSYFCNIDQSAASFYHFNGDSQLDLNFNMSRRNLDSPNKSLSKHEQLESSGVFDDFSFYSDPVEEVEVQRQIQKYHEMKSYYKKLSQQKYF